MSHSISQRIGKNIATARKLSGKTQAEIAEKVDIDTVSLSRIERGIVTPSIPTLNKIADALNVGISQLFDGVSVNTDTLIDTIYEQLTPLDETDRLFLIEQIKAWSKKLSSKKNT